MIKSYILISYTQLYTHTKLRGPCFNPSFPQSACSSWSSVGFATARTSWTAPWGAVGRRPGVKTKEVGKQTSQCQNVSEMIQQS